jgi:hypothetical protein
MYKLCCHHSQPFIVYTILYSLRHPQAFSISRFLNPSMHACLLPDFASVKANAVLHLHHAACHTSEFFDDKPYAYSRLFDMAQ